MREIAKEFPRADIEIVLSGENGGVNEKINNLVGLFRKAKYDYLIISDSDVRVAPNYLCRWIVFLGNLAKFRRNV